MVSGTATTSAMTITNESQSWVATHTRRMTGMTAAADACGR
jgi:hypothetical protein